jgi:hypothetical protein
MARFRGTRRRGEGEVVLASGGLTAAPSFERCAGFGVVSGFVPRLIARS